MKKLKELLKYIIPYKFVHLWWAWRYKGLRWNSVEKHLLATGVLTESQQRETKPFDYEKAINYLSGPDGDENYVKIAQQIREGSIPESSLKFCSPYIYSLYTSYPLIGLHVGNFVGVSLAYLSHFVKALHPDSIMVSIDPNIQHRGLRNPLNQVIGLLNEYDLQNNNLILTGYSLESNPYFEASHNADNITSSFDRGLSCGQQLRGLHLIAPAQFDFCVMDGNHIGNYLQREIDAIDHLLKAGGLLILDDVTPFWGEVQQIFEAIDTTRYQKVGADDRVGILKKLSVSQVDKR